MAVNGNRHYNNELFAKEAQERVDLGPTNPYQLRSQGNLAEEVHYGDEPEGVTITTVSRLPGILGQLPLRAVVIGILMFAVCTFVSILMVVSQLGGGSDPETTPTPTAIIDPLVFSGIVGTPTPPVGLGLTGGVGSTLVPTQQFVVATPWAAVPTVTANQNGNAPSQITIPNTTGNSVIVPVGTPIPQGQVFQPQGGAVPMGGNMTPVPVFPTQIPFYPTQVPVWATPVPYYPVPTVVYQPPVLKSNCKFLPAFHESGVMKGPYITACHPIGVTVNAIHVVVDGVTRVSSNAQTDWATPPNQTPWLTTDGLTRWTAQTPPATQCIQWYSSSVTSNSTVQFVVDHTGGQDIYQVPVLSTTQWSPTDYTVGICAFSADLTQLRAYYGQGPDKWLYALGILYDQNLVDYLFAANGHTGGWWNAYGKTFNVAGILALNASSQVFVPGSDSWVVQPKG